MDDYSIDLTCAQLIALDDYLDSEEEGEEG